MLRAFPSLIASVGHDGPAPIRHRGHRRAGVPVRAATPPRPEELAAILFVMAQPECVPGTFDAGVLSQHVIGGQFQRASRRTRSDRRCGASSSRGSPASVADPRCTGSATWRIEYARPRRACTAREMIKDPAKGQDRRLALLFVARFGGLEDLHDVEELLRDDQQLTSQRRSEEPFTTEVRDLALATLWKLSRQNPGAAWLPERVEIGWQPECRCDRVLLGESAGWPRSRSGCGGDARIRRTTCLPTVQPLRALRPDREPWRMRRGVLRNPLGCARTGVHGPRHSLGKEPRLKQLWSRRRPPHGERPNSHVRP